MIRKRSKMNEWLPDIAAYEMSLDVVTERGKQLHKKITIRKKKQTNKQTKTKTNKNKNNNKKDKKPKTTQKNNILLFTGIENVSLSTSFTLEHETHSLIGRYIHRNHVCHAPLHHCYIFYYVCLFVCWCFRPLSTQF